MPDNNKKEQHQHRIALVAENSDLLVEINNLLKEEFKSVKGLIISDESIEQLEEYQPHVLIFSCSEVAVAEEFYLTLLRTSDKFINCVHESIILCNREEVKKCYKLCRNEIFNDFALVKPIYEPYRLLLTVLQAIERRKTRLSKGTERRDYSQVSQQLAAVEQQLQQTMQDCGNLQGNVDGVEASLLGSLGTQIDEFRNMLASAPTQTGIEVVDRNQMDKAFDHFKHNKVGAEIANSSNIIKDGISQTVSNISKQSRRLGQTHSDFQEISGINKKIIMLIEDDDMFTEIIRGMLDQELYQLETAVNGAQAIAKLSNLYVDLILCDINMPQMDGLEFLGKIQGSKTYKDIPVIMTTGDSSKDSVVNALKMGAKDYLVKPFDREKFINRINKTLADPVSAAR